MNMQISVCLECEPVIKRQIDGGGPMVVGLVDSEDGRLHILVSRKHHDDTVVRVKFCVVR